MTIGTPLSKEKTNIDLNEILISKTELKQRLRVGS